MYVCTKRPDKVTGPRLDFRPTEPKGKKERLDWTFARRNRRVRKKGHVVPVHIIIQGTNIHTTTIRYIAVHNTKWRD